MTTIHITGATGFLGFNLCKYFIQKEQRVNAIVRAGNQNLLTDFSNYKLKVTTLQNNETSLSELDIMAGDTLIHTASTNPPRHSLDIREIVNVNVTFGLHLMSLAAAAGAKFVNIGTIWQHYKNENYNPVSLYAASKEAHEVFQKYFMEVEGLNAKSLELCDTYGKADPRNKLIPLLMKSKKDSEPLNLTEGNQLMDLVHIDDVVRAVESIMLNWESNINPSRMSLSSGSLISIQELVGILETVKGFKIPIKWGTALPQNSRQMFESWAHFPSPSDWEPKIKLVEGLSEIAH
jgi:nucleoside-diphosphate-sugar epimerase